jgi:membrane-associated phospholipid phosphatase
VPWNQCGSYNSCMIQGVTPHLRQSIVRGLIQALLLAIIMFSSLACYLFVLKWRGHAASVVTWIPLDEWVPFWPSWVWVYLIPYAIGPILAGTLSSSTFWWFIRRGLIVMGLALLIFTLFPTQTDIRHRQQPIGTGLTAEVYESVIKIDDPPANAAPSLHVSLTCLMLLALFRDYPLWWPLWSGFIGLVWLSTLFTRQHHLIDVVTGVLLAVTVAWLPELMKRSRRRPNHA